MRLKHRVAIITGAARDLGRGFSLKLAEEGAKILAVDIDMEGLKRAEALAKGKGGEMYIYNF